MMKRIMAYFVYVLLSTITANAQFTHVLELFTYDGCTSCILAKRKIKRLHDEGYFEKNGMLLLTYHVDFEDSDGFTDSLNTEFNQQHLLKYMHRGLTDGLYTPVMVLDGEFASPATQLSELDSLLSVSKHTKKEAFPIIQITNAGIEGASIEISTSFDGVTDVLSEAEILTLLVKKEDRHHILSGENSGAMRYDVNAVFATQVWAAAIVKNAVLTIPSPILVNLNQWQVIVLLTHRPSGEIMGFDTFEFH